MGQKNSNIRGKRAAEEDRNGTRLFCHNE